MAVLNPRDDAAKQACSLFDAPLRDRLFFTYGRKRSPIITFALLSHFSAFNLSETQNPSIAREQNKMSFLGAPITALDLWFIPLVCASSCLLLLLRT